MSFIAPQFTNKGKQLQARALSGECTITFTTIGLGSGELETQAISALTDLIQTVKKVGVSDIRVINPDQVQLKAVFQNVGMSSGFFWREVGLFAADPDNPDDRTKDILYCYQNAGDLAEYIPSASSQLVDKIINMAVVVADATQVNISFYSETYALKEDLDAHKTDTNAHSELFAQYVKKSGDTMSGNLAKSVNNSSFELYGGSAWANGALLKLNGKESAENGSFSLTAHNGSEFTELKGTANGSLQWNGVEVLTAKGGTLNGRLTFLLNDAIYRNVDTSYLHLCGGNVFGKSASLILNGGQNLDGSSSYGGFELTATNGEDMTNLVGQSTGALTWGGKNLVRSVNGVNADVVGNIIIETGEIESMIAGESTYNGKPVFYREVRFKNGLQISTLNCWAYNEAILTWKYAFKDDKYALIVSDADYLNACGSKNRTTTTFKFMTAFSSLFNLSAIAIGFWK